MLGTIKRTYQTATYLFHPPGGERAYYVTVGWTPGNYQDGKAIDRISLADRDSDKEGYELAPGPGWDKLAEAFWATHQQGETQEC